MNDLDKARKKLGLPQRPETEVAEQVEKKRNKGMRREEIRKRMRPDLYEV